MKKRTVDPVISKPYWDTPSVATDIGNWETEMARFIYEDLGHANHLMAANYTSGKGPTYLGADYTNDHAYLSPYINIVDYNFYRGVYTPRFEDQSVTQVPYILSTIDKPLMHSEIGHGTSVAIEKCDNNVEFIRDLWCTAFSGTSAASFDWNSYSHDTYGTWTNYGILNTFISGYDFANQFGWEAQHDIVTFPSDVEIFAWVNKPNGEAVGVVVNRRYNVYTQGDLGSLCVTGISDGDLGGSDATGLASGAQYKIPFDINASIAPPIRLNLLSGDYKFDWYNVLDGSFVSTTLGTVPTGFNSLIINYPLLSIEDPINDPFRPILAFKVIKTHSHSSSNSNNIGISENNISASDTLKYIVTPHPSSETIMIYNESNIQETRRIKIIDSGGKILYDKITNGSIENINISSYENGIYVILINSARGGSVKRLIVQK